MLLFARLHCFPRSVNIYENSLNKFRLIKHKETELSILIPMNEPRHICDETPAMQILKTDKLYSSDEQILLIKSSISFGKVFTKWFYRILETNILIKEVKNI